MDAWDVVRTWSKPPSFTVLRFLYIHISHWSYMKWFLYWGPSPSTRIRCHQQLLQTRWASALRSGFCLGLRAHHQSTKFSLNHETSSSFFTPALPQLHTEWSGPRLLQSRSFNASFHIGRAEGIDARVEKINKAHGLSFQARWLMQYRHPWLIFVLMYMVNSILHAWHLCMRACVHCKRALGLSRSGINRQHSKDLLCSSYPSVNYSWVY